jgi:signal transduction histidine kinase
VLLAVVIGAAALHANHIDLPADKAQRLLDLARATVMMSAAAAFTVCLIRWQQAGETPVALIGTAVLVYGGVVVGTAGLLLPILQTDLGSPLISAIRAAGLLAVLGLLVAALLVPPVDTRLPPVRLAAGTLGLVALLAAVLHQLPGAADVLAFGHRSASGLVEPSSADRLVLSGVWAALALVLCYQGLRRNRSLLAWTGLMLFALALSELTAIAAASMTDIWQIGSIAIQTLAMVFVLAGLAEELQRSYLDTRARLFDSQIAMETVEARRTLGDDFSGRRRHDVGNALMALQGAARTLEREHDRLSEDNRKRMAEVLGSSVQRLGRLVREDPTVAGAFAVAEPVESAMSLLRSAGVELEVRAGEDVRAHGVQSAFTEALRRVADAVYTERPRGPVQVVAARVAESVWVSIAFEPSAPRALRLLTRLRREPSDNALGYFDEGSTLTVAARLVSDTGGRLMAEPEGENRLAFRFELPAALD